MAMAKHMDALLEATDRPLSFVVIVPAWNDTRGHAALQASTQLRRYELLAQEDHGYCEGKQSLRRTRYRIASFDTSIFFLQNLAGATKWPATDEAIADLRKAFSPKQAIEASGGLGLVKGTPLLDSGPEVGAVDGGGATREGAVVPKSKKKKRRKGGS